MNIEDLIPEKYWGKVKVTADECWEWYGPARRRNGKLYLYWYRNLNREVAARSTVLNAAYPGVGMVVAICQNERCISPEHLDRESSDPGRLLFVSHNIREEDGHHIWTGQYSGVTPIMPVRTASGRGASMSVRRFVFEQEYGRRVNPGTDVLSTCGIPSCVHHKHAYAPTESEKRKARRDRDRARTVPSTCPRGHARLEGVSVERNHVDCYVCKREEAAEFIAARNKELLHG